jgi:hypothetical protein
MEDILVRLELSTDDSWIVLSPRRTGGKLLALTIAQAYRNKGIDITEYDPSILDKKTIENSEIWHTHDVNILDFRSKNTWLILNTRNIVEITLSWFKAKTINQYHLWTSKPKIILDLNRSIPKFNLDIGDFKKLINELIIWHLAICNRNPSCVCIDYATFENDPYNIFKLLDIEIPKDYHIPLMKTPGSDSDWIENWDEINDFITKNPQLNCPPQMEFFLKNTLRLS